MIQASTLAAAALPPLLPPPVWAASPQEPLPESLTGKVVWDADGDTSTILVGKIQHKVRLAAGDCPERGLAQVAGDGTC